MKGRILWVDEHTLTEVIEGEAAEFLAREARLIGDANNNAGQLTVRMVTAISDNVLIGPTFNELGALMGQMLEEARTRAGHSEAGREFSLSITHLEDALTRYNGGRYREKGVWKRADPDLA